MLRQKDVNKYKKRSKYDQLLSLSKDGRFFLNNERPIKDNLIKTINQEKVTKFIDDILVSKKITRLLFRSNSNFEINYYLNTKNKFFTHKTPLVTKSQDNITVKQVKKQACLDMKNNVNSFKKYRQNLVHSMDNVNKRKIKIFKKELRDIENLPNEQLNQNRINGFIRSYNSIRRKFDMRKNQELVRNNSCNLNNYIKLNKENIKYKFSKKSNNLLLKSISSDTNESNGKPTHFINKGIEINKSLNKTFLPNYKLDLNDVFSRLYHNEVLLSPSSSTGNLKRPQSSKMKSTLNYEMENSATYNPKIVFKLKKVIKSTSGKEFTLKITKDIISRCFIKYSGGPSVLNMGFYKKDKEENKNNYEMNNMKVMEDFLDDTDNTKRTKKAVNFYKLVDRKNGNSFLHKAVIGGYEDFVRYFLEKKSNINLKNNDGNTPLHLALYNKKKNPKIIDILMEYKPKLDLKNNKGEIPFELFTDEMKVKYGIDKLIIGKGN